MENEPNVIEVLRELIRAAKPFLDDTVVDETAGTIPLLEALEKAIEKAEGCV